MSDLFGLRVFPGPSWKYDPKDFLGTIVKPDVDDDRVDLICDVKWDDGSYNNYRIGKDDKYDLLVYDSSQIGVKHNGIKCAGCKQDITGPKWGCIECSNFLCNECYMVNFHVEKCHHFYRKDSEKHLGIYVGIRNTDNKVECQGIFKGSLVEEYKTIFGRVCGTVDSFKNRKETYKSMLYINTPQDTLKKLKFGYKGVIEVKLDSTVSSTQQNLKNVYRNHLKVVRCHPIFNYEYLKIFGNDFRTSNFTINSKELVLEIGDIVYVDCFDSFSLQKYQHGYGESNIKIEKLIGKQGIVRSVNGHLISVFFENLNESLFFNSNILFNVRNCNMKIVRICQESKLSKIIADWKKKLINAKLKDIYWMPDNAIINKIQDKIGVIFIDNLPGGLVGVRFKIYQDNLCMLLPESCCLDIEDNEEDSELLLSLELAVSSDDDLKISEGRMYIDENEEFLRWISNEDISISVWYNLMLIAIDKANVDSVKALLNISVSGKDKWLIKIVCMGYNKDNFHLKPNFAVLLVGSINSLGNHCVENGDNLFHLATKHNDIVVVELLLKKFRKDLIDSVNKINGYSALHYAVENSYIPIIELLMKHKCDIYIKANEDESTALHLALKYYYIRSFCCILESLEDDLQITISDKFMNDILHLSASYPSDVNLQKWEDVMKTRDITSINELEEKFQVFKSKSKSKQPVDFDIMKMPFVILSCLIFRKRKNALRTWFDEKNKTDRTPENEFLKSIENFDKGLSIISTKRLFMRFYLDLDNSFQDEVCEFCNCNYASVTYHPCGHKIHCDYCAFMPYKCTRCDADIDKRYQDDPNSELKSYEDWEKLSVEVSGDKFIQNLGDWYKYIRETLKYLRCKLCHTNNWNLVFDCGHQLCTECYDKLETKMCIYCNKKNAKVIQLKDA